MKDKIFAKSFNYSFGGFEFDQKVALAFDDMVKRSIPNYDLIQDIISDLSLRFNNNGVIYDIGCSTGNTILNIAKKHNGGNLLELFGIDPSKEMLEIFHNKISTDLSRKNIKINIICDELNETSTFFIKKPSVVILTLVLQFIRPLQRQSIINKIYENLTSNGVLIIIEKIIEEDKVINKNFIEMYYDYKKKMGYSSNEISRKRDALENYLIPLYSKENLKLLTQAGFEATIFYSWLNFQGYIARKK